MGTIFRIPSVVLTFVLASLLTVMKGGEIYKSAPQ
jgi:hypothetical protein